MFHANVLFGFFALRASNRVINLMGFRKRFREKFERIKEEKEKRGDGYDKGSACTGFSSLFLQGRREEEKRLGHKTVNMWLLRE